MENISCFKIRDKSRGYGVSDEVYRTREQAENAAITMAAMTGSQWEVIKQNQPN